MHLFGSELALLGWCTASFGISLARAQNGGLLGSNFNQGTFCMESIYVQD